MTVGWIDGFFVQFMGVVGNHFQFEDNLFSHFFPPQCTLFTTGHDHWKNNCFSNVGLRWHGKVCVFAPAFLFRINTLSFLLQHSAYLYLLSHLNLFAITCKFTNMYEHCIRHVTGLQCNRPISAEISALAQLHYYANSANDLIFIHSYHSYNGIIVQNINNDSNVVI